MLNTSETLLMMRAQAALVTHGEAALAAELGAVLMANAEAKVSVQAARSQSPGGAGGRPPAARLLVEVEPGYVVECLGAKAAHAAVAQALQDMGDRRALPSANSMGVMLSRHGAWTTLVDTDNGTVSITVRKPPETGTDLAKAGSAPKREKRR